MWLAACTSVVYEHKDDVYVKAYFADMAKYVIVASLCMLLPCLPLYVPSQLEENHTRSEVRS